ncbi:hypothetical protein [Phyllobacterium lublinensis]|uniref:hypothetical protein n=1 Tax=Phyllobacterium lublinensis TaxID=2875708 RepID=UPI001CCEE3C3|nr:hypothetical protein [Phyllobacterium sp. 2063]MBZ9654101.1 hypothetical protein [Phyllobacterium sp. 2063]
MTTIAQVRQVVQPLLQRHADLALVGRYLLIKPVHHFTRGIFIERGGSSPKPFVPMTSVSLLFNGSTRMRLGWGLELCYFSFEGVDDDLARQEKADRLEFIRWEIDHSPGIERMLRVIEIALDTLRPITTLETMVAFGTQPGNYTIPFERRVYTRLLIAVATGDLDQALEIIDAPSMKPREIRQYMDQKYPTFYPALVAHDRQELARILHELEATTVKNLKYDKVWESTPFPLELEYA